MFALTFGLLISDYMSRQVLNAVFPLLKTEWALSDSQLGGLSSIVALMVGVLTLPLSYLADRIGRARSLVVMAVIWSLATAAARFARNYPEMFAARFMVGVGEAAYGSVGVAVVVSVFPPTCGRRWSARSWRAACSAPCSAWRWAASSHSSFGWRWAFGAMALFGLTARPDLPGGRHRPPAPRGDGPSEPHGPDPASSPAPR